MQRIPGWLTLLPLVAVAIFACGGPAPEPAPDDGEPLPSIPAALGLEAPGTLTLGREATLPLSLSRNETAMGEVTFSAEGLPSGVSASFEPPSLTGSTLETTLKLTASSDAERGHFLVSVRATGPEDMTVERAFSLAVQGHTIRGTLLSTLEGTPPERTLVRVGEQWVHTREDGTFTVSDVGLPYDLEFSYPGLLGDFITEIFEGVSTPTPRITGMLLGPREPPGPPATIQGTVTPLPSEGEVISVCVSMPEPEASRCVDAEVHGAVATFQMELGLFSDANEDILLAARRYSVNHAGARTAFLGYAETRISVSSGATTPVQLALREVGSRQTELTLVPPGEVSGSAVVAAVATGDQLTLGGVNRSGLSVVEPDDSQAWVLAAAFLVGGGESSRLQPADTEPILLPEPAELIAPQPGATITAQTEFISRTSEPGVRANRFKFQDNRMVVVHTLRDRVQLPTLGGALRPDELESWSVTHAPSTGLSENDPVLYEGRLYRYHLGLSMGNSVPTPLQPLSFSLSRGHSFASGAAPPGAASTLELLSD